MRCTGYLLESWSIECDMCFVWVCEMRFRGRGVGRCFVIADFPFSYIPSRARFIAYICGRCVIESRCGPSFLQFAVKFVFKVCSSRCVLKQDEW